MRGQDVLKRHFPAGTGSPAAIIAKADQIDAVVAAARGTVGIASVAALGPAPPARRPRSSTDWWKLTWSCPIVLRVIFCVLAQLFAGSGRAVAADRDRRPFLSGDARGVRARIHPPLRCRRGLVLSAVHFCVPGGVGDRLHELGFAVAFGVLLDTLFVRSVLVPALSYDIGRRIWWPMSPRPGRRR